MLIWLMGLGIAVCLTAFFVGLTVYSGFQKQPIKGLILICILGLIGIIVCFYYFQQAFLTPQL